MRAILLRVSPLSFFRNTSSFPLGHWRTCVFLVQQRLCRATNREIRKRNVRDAVCGVCIIRMYACPCRAIFYVYVTSVYVCACVCVCADKSARAPRYICVWESARGVCTRRCERECFTPDYYVSRASVHTNVEKRSRVRGKTRVTPKITLTNARIYRATLTALNRAESIYFVRTVCAANTVG